ncbi:flavin reductase family protein [Streptomyces cahuitamycinicus]|uniref:Flavin reductase n=1 Tax=Streptomyces cahuitamycinicus TaxID=2070367 RepID=A0A2N8TUK9_9ACTN|nr:flavin reductase [Streptomyces cahuitamycinicus]
MTRGTYPAAPAEPDLRSVMRLFPTGVAVLLAGRGDETVATTVNSLTSVTLEPPTVLVSLRKYSRAHTITSAAGGFCLSFLSGLQGDHARLFASRNKPTGHELEKYFGIAADGGRILDGALATLHCTVSTTHLEGDHCLFLGRVTAAHHGDTDQGALLFHQGRMASV